MNTSIIMKTTEKIALLYLRLNGFFLMPHFTTFSRDEKQRHVDILGVRLKRSREEVDEETLFIDEDFIGKLNGYTTDIKLWAEVGTGTARNLFPQEKAEYCRKIFGEADNLKKVYFDFDKRGEDLEESNGVLIIPPKRCKKTILSRFAQMESDPIRSMLKGLSKEGSWNWSEEFLADLLYLRKIGFLKEEY